LATITYLTTIHFDFGAIDRLREQLEQLAIQRPLIVTDKGVVAAGLLERVRDRLPSGAAATIFDETPANPTERASRVASDLFVAAGCDGLIGLGGGSAIDLAKAVSLMATHPGDLAHYAAIEGGASRITARLAPLVAIPTTAGTGSEVGRGAVIVLEDGRKLGLLSPHLIPKCAICDPELTLGLPPALTAGTGMDAIAHCIETFLAPAINPPAEAIALDGLVRGIGHIERAYRDGSDRTARWEMMMAAMEGAMAFQKGLGAVHAMSHPLGALKGRSLHHGTLNAVLLPVVLAFNRDHVGLKYARLRELLGLAAEDDLGAWIRGLNGRLGLPASLGAMGVTEADIPTLAQQAERDHCNATNPRPATAEDYDRLFRAALASA
jgi:alcohol dehydrogenase class IV